MTATVPIRVLLLTEDTQFMGSYVEALESKCIDVDVIPDVDGALYALHSAHRNRIRGQGYRLVIYDTCLSPGRTYAARPTYNGLMTGLWFERDIAAAFPSTPSLLFTNHRVVAAERNRPKRRRYALCKCDLLPDEFADGVAGIIRAA